MKIHRFIGTYDLDRSHLILTDHLQVRQMHSVLHLKKGEHIMLGDGKCYESEAEIISLSRKEIGLALAEKRRNTNESQKHTTLYCSLLKHENFEWVVQKATEMGITAIVPIIAARTVGHAYKKERLQKIIHEAAEQSGRGVVPVLSNPMSLNDAQKQASAGNDKVFFFDASGMPFIVTDSADCRTVGIFIGPEGGWTNEELASTHEKKIHIVHMGKLILRAETAATLASYLIGTDTKLS
ncbi:MAG: RsmE family RNA methyltransferase [bacterium]|nr:RsmE family RNA methyltransferase [bacterium]MDZ4299658.1 RsmE family RNA methyltransferase [Candidatus Sungbacteria bacterium]